MRENPEKLLPVPAILHTGTAVGETTETGIVQLILLHPVGIASSQTHLCSNILR